jgi:hypothetical protein
MDPGTGSHRGQLSCVCPRHLCSGSTLAVAYWSFPKSRAASKEWDVSFCFINFSNLTLGGIRQSLLSSHTGQVWRILFLSTQNCHLT